MSIISNYGRSFGSYDHDELTERAKRVVCKHCGGELVTALIVYDIYGGAGEELYLTVNGRSLGWKRKYMIWRGIM